MQGKTLLDKLWDYHRVADAGDGYDLLAIDRLLLHERTGGVALKSLAERGLPVKAPDRVFALMDHIVSFREGRGRDEARSPGGEVFITQTREMAQKEQIHLIDTDSPMQGIVHVVAPEKGIALPGLSMVCPDSHTCSLGALGALAWGVGSSEAEHVMATGAIRVKKPDQMQIIVSGELQYGVSAKDLALHLIAKHGASGGKRCAIEFSGTTIDALSVEERLTLCNLAVEFAAFTAIIAPDKKTLDFVRDSEFGPQKNNIEKAESMWLSLCSDDHAQFDEIIEIDASQIKPQISWGTSPEETIGLDDVIPDTASLKSLTYMGLQVGEKIQGKNIGGAFIGSCTNGRLSDLISASEVLRGQKVAAGVKAVCVPGSKTVKHEAEQLGLEQIFKQAGFEWGEPGCAMCFYAGGETFPPETRVVSSTNRNFEGRQGPGVRTHLAAPSVVAASAIAGVICSPSELKNFKREQ